MRLVTFERLAGQATSLTSRSSLAYAEELLEDLEGGPAAGRRVGALLSTGAAEEIVDLNRAFAYKLAVEDSGAPEAEADSRLPADPLEFLRGFGDAIVAAREALAFVVACRGRYDAPDLGALGVIEPREALRLHAPVPRPGKILGVAANYPSHAAERGQAEPPPEPVLFVKASSAVIGPDAEIRLCEASAAVDYEGELAVVIACRAKDVRESDALACVAGYCAANDVTARDYQFVRGQHFIGKSFDSFAPLGPVLVTTDEVPDPQDLRLRTTLSGELVQSGHTKEMSFPVARIIAFASRLMTLEPGDVILTGTPAGVGASRQPPRFLRDGDVVEVQIDRVGTLRNFVRGSRGAARRQSGS